VVVSQKLFGRFFGRVGALYNDQRAYAGQCGLDGFDWVNFYGAAVDTSVIAVGLFGVAKRGVPVSAICSAAL